MSSFADKVRRGRGPFWKLLKRMAHAVLHLHLPMGSWARPLFGLLYRLHVLAREGLLWLLRFWWCEPLFRSQCALVGADFRMEQLPYIAGHGRIVIGDRVRLSGKSSIAFNNQAHAEPELIVGDGTFIGHDCGFNVARGVRIGRHCLLATRVRIYDADGHPLDAARRREHAPVPAEMIRPVSIGDDVWIGSGAVILKGVTVGDRAVIGASAVVTRDVPADTVVAGNPARVVRCLVEHLDVRNP